MHPETFFILFLAVVAFISFVIAVFAWHRRVAPGAGSLMLLMFAVAEWSIGYAFELASINMQDKIFWSKLEYIAIATIPLIWMILAAQYAGRDKWVKPYVLAILGIEPAVILCLVFTNKWHSLVWTSVNLDTYGIFPVLNIQYQMGFWIHVIFSYFLLLIGTYLFLHSHLHTSAFYKKQSGILVVASFAPWICNILYLMHWGPFPNFDMTPLGFTVTGLLIIWGIAHYRLFDIIPVARDLVVDSILDPVIVLDMQNRVVDLNLAARKIVEIKCPNPIGKRGGEAFAPWMELVEQYRNVYEAEAEVAASRDGLPVFYDLSISPLHNKEGQLRGRIIILRDITKHKQAETLQNSLGRMQKAMEETVRAMALILEIRDPYTAGHQRRVAQLAAAIAAEMDLAEEQKEGLSMATLIHDIGKIYVPSEFLNKPGHLTDNEFNMIRTHSQVGYDILKTIDFPWPVARIVLQHHERINGSGYPNGLVGQDILLEARILGIADVVEAMSTHRPYRVAPGINKALEEIDQNKGILYDSEVVQVCLRLFNEKGFQWQ